MVWTDLRQRVFAFVMSVLKLHKPLARLGPEYAHIALQLFRAASGIGSNLEESDVGISRRDRGAKQAIALREARESRFWLRVLVADGTMVDAARPLLAESEEFVAMLTSSVKTLPAEQTTEGREGSLDGP
jgi:four helix bundle protein